MTPESAIRRKRLDHERYERNKEERKAKQRDYYQKNRQKILNWHRNHRLAVFALKLEEQKQSQRCQSNIS